MSDKIILYYLFGYIGISLIITLLLTIYLQKKFLNSAKKIFIFMLLLNISIPIIGYFFSVWISYYMIHVKHKKAIKDINIIDLEEFGRYFLKIQRIFGEGSMLELMQNDYAPTSLKIKALVAMSENISKNNISIIKQTLSNSDDEIRLYSFAIIDKLEKNLNKQIHHNMDALHKTKNKALKTKIATQLAYLYWDMIYYELSDKSLQTYLFNQVEKYINIALQNDKYDIKLHVLLGRVYMIQKKFDRAATEFAFVHEVNPQGNDYNMPYLAEIEFNLGAYHITKAIMTQIKSFNNNSTLYPIVEQWSGV